MLHCISPDPNETARDMIESYKKECSLLKIRPISKLLEQLEVGHMTSHMTTQFHACCNVVFQRLDDLNTPIDTLDLKGELVVASHVFRCLITCPISLGDGCMSVCSCSLCVSIMGAWAVYVISSCHCRNSFGPQKL